MEALFRAQVPENWHGKPALEFLSESLPALSKADLRRIAHGGGLQIEGEPALPNEALVAGEAIEVFAEDLDPQEDVAPPEDLWPELIALEGPIAAFAKKPGVPTLGRRRDEPSVYSAVAKILADHGETRRVHPIHRLDKETSGVLLFALTADAARELSAAFEERRVQKTYWALVHGQPPASGTIDAPIGRAGKAGKSKVFGKDAKPAETSFQLIEKFRDFAWICLMPKTGRSHQIRVHMAHAGYSVVGDGLYGGRNLLLSEVKKSGYREGRRGSRPLIDRVALHAAELRLELEPGSALAAELGKTALEYLAPLPHDLELSLKMLSRYGVAPVPKGPRGRPGPASKSRRR